VNGHEGGDVRPGDGSEQRAPSPDQPGDLSGWLSGGLSGGLSVATQLGELARELQAIDDPDQILRQTVHAAIQLIPGTDEASISEIRGRTQIAHKAASSELARRIDTLMTELGEGPCLDAAFGRQTVRVTDMTREQRWPTFAARAAAWGAISMLSFQLFVAHDNLGALNLYAREPDAFTDEAESIGLLFATHAAVAYADAQRVDHLHQAIATRDVISQAVGILIERHGLTAGRAFATLVKYSQDTNRKIRHIAIDVVTDAITNRHHQPPPRT
jgi:hypothetical protein